jgi:hypothetical protein
MASRNITIYYKNNTMEPGMMPRYGTQGSSILPLLFSSDVFSVVDPAIASDPSQT